MEQREQAHKGTLEERRVGPREAFQCQGPPGSRLSLCYVEPSEAGPEPATELQLAVVQDHVNLDKASRVS